MKRMIAISLALIVAAGSLSGCLDTRVGRATTKGAVIGGVAGGLIGGSAKGVLVGGLIGAGTGYVIGKTGYRCKKTNIFGQQYWGTCLR
ncbi:MAG TPA: hypothetical protein VFB16_09220 [Bauldia sp.]|nr:hypothetical protein [Bauldia sp.]